MSTYSIQQKYLILFSLALINDVVDLLGLLNPLFEVVFDVVIIALIHFLLRTLNPLIILVTLLDVIPGVDIAPFWTLYVFYLYLSKVGEKRRVKVKVEG